MSVPSVNTVSAFYAFLKDVPVTNASLITYDSTTLLTAPEFQALYDEWHAVNTAGTKATFQAALTAWLAKLDPGASSNPNPTLFPRTWDQFIAAFRKNFSITTTDPLAGAYTAFKDSYLAMLQASGGGGDFAALGLIDLDQEFQNSFGAFLANYQFTAINQTGTSITATSGPPVVNFKTGDTLTFINNYTLFLTSTARALDSTSTGGATLASYQRLFQAFFPNASYPGDFHILLNDFVAKIEADPTEGGSFIPSQFLPRFFAYIKKKYETQQGILNNSTGTGGAKLTMIWTVFALVLKMIQVIQQTAVVQSDRLGFLTRYQQAYTTLMSNIPTFARGDKSAFSGGDVTSGSTTDSQAATRAEINPVNQAYYQNLQAYRSILSDDAKQVQTQVNNQNQSITQQSNLATNILQEMNTIVSSIFR